MFNPIQEFSEKICRNDYTVSHNKITKHARALFDDDLYNYTTNLKNDLAEKLKNFS